MGEHPVVTEGDTVATEGEEGQKQGNIYPSDVVVPK
jgi:hypothetical protein